jgi:hypothetical protein
MADSNRTKLSMALEDSFGGGSTGTNYELRLLSESVKSDLTLATSDEIRSYRDIPELNLTDKGTSGSLNGELSWEAFARDQLKWSMMSSAWSDSGSDVTVQTGESTLIAPGGYPKRYSHGGNDFDNDPVVGQWIYITGAANAASNGFHKVAAVDSESDWLEVEEAIGATETAVLTIKMLPQVVNGTSFNSCVIQRQYTDIADANARFLGQAISGFSLDASGTDTVKFNLDITGLSESTLTDASLDAIDTDADPVTYPTMTTSEGVVWVRENAADYACTSFQFQVGNNLRKKYALGTLGALDFNEGDFEVTGSMQAYFEDSTAYDKFLNQTETSLSICISDGTSTKGHAFIFDFPMVKFTDAQRVAGGRNQDIIADISWQALYDANEGITMRIARSDDV